MKLHFFRFTEARQGTERSVLSLSIPAEDIRIQDDVDQSFSPRNRIMRVNGPNRLELRSTKRFVSRSQAAPKPRPGIQRGSNPLFRRACRRSLKTLGI